MNETYSHKKSLTLQAHTEASPVYIRKAGEGDWPAIIALIQENPDTIMQTDLPSLGDFFVAMDGDTVAGCCALQVYSQRLAEIRSLAVGIPYRGNGIAASLIQACLEEAKRKDIHEVIAITGALELFEEAGFKPFKGDKSQSYALIKVVDESEAT